MQVCTLPLSNIAFNPLTLAMFKRGELVNGIIEQLIHISNVLMEKSKLNLTDDNIHAESFMRELLNLIFDLELQDLNIVNANYPGIDLGDKQKKIAYQITTTSTVEKIEAMLHSCLKYEYYKV